MLRLKQISTDDAGDAVVFTTCKLHLSMWKRQVRIEAENVIIIALLTIILSIVLTR